MDIEKLKELSGLFSIATTLDNLLTNMSVEQAAFVLRVPEDAGRELIEKHYAHLSRVYSPEAKTGNELKHKLLEKAREVLLEQLAPMNSEIYLKFDDLVSKPLTRKDKRAPWGDWYNRTK